MQRRELPGIPGHSASHPGRPDPEGLLTSVIAIDGPSAGGKSSTAAAVAREIDALHLDSGALYRALTALAISLPERTAGTILTAATARRLELRQAGGVLLPFLDGKDAEPLIRSPEVTTLVSAVSAMPEIRAWVNDRLRTAVKGHRIVVIDGRDIGTAVFPDATLKIYLTATPEARARRRLIQRGDELDPGRLREEAARLAERDRQDAGRPVAPLRRADDAILLDTTDLSFEEQVGEIVRLVRSRP